MMKYDDVMFKLMNNLSNISHQRNFEHSKLYYTGRNDENNDDDDDDHDHDRCWLLSYGDNHDEIMMM